MAYNICINGLGAVHAGSGGKLITIDICKTQCGPPIVPIPYPNVSESKDADKTVSSVKVAGNPVCTVDSVFTQSKGDEAGSHGGIRSGGTQGEASFLMGSPNVQFEGTAAVRSMDLMVSNQENTPPAPLMQGGGTIALSATLTDPTELNPLVAPYKTAVGIFGENGAWHSSHLVIDIGTQTGLRQTVAQPTDEGEYLLFDNLHTEISDIALCVKEAKPWVHKKGKGAHDLILPLVQHQNQPRNEETAEPVTSLVQLTLKRYLDETQDPEHVTPLEAGWVYVFLNGHLWRELEVTSIGELRDVDLATWQGVDGGGLQSLDDLNRKHIQRVSSGISQEGLEVPKILNGEPCEVQIAYSDNQWSWERITSLGGMNPEDPRLCYYVQQDDTLSQIALRYPVLERNTQALADLNNLANPDYIQPEQRLQIREPDIAGDNADDLRAQRTGAAIDFDQLESANYELCLYDAVSIAKEHVSVIMETHNDIAELITGLTNGDTVAAYEHSALIPANMRPHRADKYKLAVELNELLNRTPQALNAPNVTLSEQEQDSLERLQSYSDDHLDKAYLAQYLQLDTLKQKARVILQSKQDLVALFDEDTPASFTECCIDLGYLPSETLYLLPKTLTIFMLVLKGHPAQAFVKLLPDNEFMDGLAENDPGEDLLLRLLGTHPNEEQHKVGQLITPESTGDGIDDWQDRQAPFFDSSKWQLNDLESGSFHQNVGFDQTKKALTLLVGMYNQLASLPSANTNQKFIGQLARLGAQEDALINLKRSMQSISGLFVEFETTVTEYARGYFPDHVIPFDIKLRKQLAANQYTQLKNSFNEQGANIATPNGNKAPYSAPLSSIFKQTPLAHVMQGLADEAANKASITPHHGVKKEIKIKILGLKRDESVSIVLSKKDIEPEPLPKGAQNQHKYLNDRLTRLQNVHRIPFKQLAMFRDGRVPLSTRAIQADLLTTKLNHLKDIAELDLDPIKKQSISHAITDRNGDVKKMYYRYHMLTTLLAGLEFVNLYRVWKDDSKGAGRRRLDIASSVATIASLAGYVLNLRTEFRLGAVTEDDIDIVKGKVESTSSYTSQKAKLASIERNKLAKSRVNSFRFLHGGAGVVSGLSMVSSGLDGYKDWQANNEWGVAANVAFFVSEALVFSSSTFSFMASLRLMPLAFAQMFGAAIFWPTFLLGVAGLALYIWLADTPLETLIKNSPFGLERKNQKQKEDVVQQHCPALTIEKFRDALMSPRIRFFEHTGVLLTNRDFWNAKIKLSIKGMPQSSACETAHALYWRPVEVNSSRQGTWVRLSLDNEASNLPHINWLDTIIEPYDDSSGHLLIIPYKALQPILQHYQQIELKFELRVYPNGKTTPLGQGINEPLELPMPDRAEKPPFKIVTHKFESTTISVRAPRPISQIPEYISGDRALSLFT
ncbi:PAAR-like domain-containing protein [Marinomonas balearica]|uniref:LysM domain-containing protein n=1 Tax=Marinomonas balearica TaxID=491947 RepID=A0A4R6M7K1_9GAMM|nr:PAAR-like domain-containing protein [Marinomonas balearica]TDO97398.1 LysM domain-containing protein [Marinomonas balearica]